MEIINKGSFRPYLQPALDEVLFSGKISLPDMKESRRNVPWHAEEGKYGESKKYYI